MRRRRLNPLAVLSLLLCLAAVAVWVRSDSVSDNVYWGSPDLVIGCTTGCGHVRLTWESPTRPGGFAQLAGLHHDTYGPLQLEALQPWVGPGVRLLGFRLGTQVET